MSCCNAVMTWKQGGNTFVLIQVGENPIPGYPFLLMSDAESVESKSVSCREALELIIKRHEKCLPTEFSPAVERTLEGIRLNAWDTAR